MDSKKRIKKRYIIEASLTILLMIVMLSVLSVFSKEICCADKETVRVLEKGWYYLEDGKEINVTLPEIVESTEETFVLYNDSLTDSEAGLTINLEGAQYNSIISYNDRILYQYEDSKFPRNSQMKSKLYCDGILPQLLENGVLKIEFFNDGNDLYKLPRIYIGTQKEIMLKQLKDSAFPVLIAVIMLALSIFAVGVGIYLRRIHVMDIRFINVAFFLILCSVWCLTDSAILQQYSKHYHIDLTVSFYAFMLLAIPMVHFIRNTCASGNHFVLDLLGITFYINAIIQCVLHHLGIFEFVEMLFITHLLLAVGCICGTIFILREYKAHKSQEIQTIILAFLILAASGVLAMVLYWSLEISYYSSIFEIGILIFVALLLRGIIVSAGSNFRAKTEIDVLRRLAKEDRLTGIGNRRAFEEYINELQTEVAMLKDALLIFVDINFLKKTNDHYGHSAGDELIIGTSRCLRNTFDKHGKIFRIGGDEFCIIIKNPPMKEEEWYKVLENEIQLYNYNSRCMLSVAKGGSYLRESDGSIKTISDWKYQADRKMYEDKNRKRRQ